MKSKVRKIRRGATATEYLLIMAVIILPLALWVLPVSVKMVVLYGKRNVATSSLPFP